MWYKKGLRAMFLKGSSSFKNSQAGRSLAARSWRVLRQSWGAGFPGTPYYSYISMCGGMGGMVLVLPELFEQPER